MKPIDIAFFGTHTFAATVLKGLIDSPLFCVKKVITQPDKPVGRKKVMTAPETKLLALAHDISVDQPASLKKYTYDADAYDLNIVAQYGKIIPESIVEGPTHGTLNTHTSLLPKYRGASPIQSALVHGETVTGVTIMKMDAGMDTGPIILQESIDIHPDETYAQLDQRLAPLSTRALLKAAPAYVAGELLPKAQNDAEATHCKLLSRDDGRIDWNASATNIYNQYRGLTPWPGVWTTANDKRIKLLHLLPGAEKTDHAPGTLFTAHGSLFLQTITGTLEVTSIQLEGKPATTSEVFLHGNASSLPLACR
ncbi:MAG: methionyl-tRNA formyltransferase [Candidatus Magasanikbacteria bacterium]|jgi:methionyl-tRNA formyltransferase|nr:methionyl-tRNA formyltransferase [Candidatus Magasanikbacteria bacterium]